MDEGKSEQRYCPKCGSEIMSGSDLCNECGYNIAEMIRKDTLKRNVAMILFIIGLLPIIIGLFFGQGWGWQWIMWVGHGYENTPAMPTFIWFAFSPFIIIGSIFPARKSFNPRYFRYFFVISSLALLSWLAIAIHLHGWGPPAL